MKKGFSSIILIVVLVSVGIGYVAIQSKSKVVVPSINVDVTSTPSTTQTTGEFKTFNSSYIMDFSVEIPQNYTALEKSGAVTISFPTGKILIGMNSTDYENVEDYIKFSRNNLNESLKNRHNKNINGLEAISGNIEDESIYFIYTKYNVYLLSTKDKSLYSDLDQIAQSFKYTP